MTDKQKQEQREAISDILKNTCKDPKQWLKDYLDIEEEGDILRVYVTLGGPTVWFAFNRAKHNGRLYYHTQSGQTFKPFGKATYDKLIQYVY